jgi:hypothetical protein
VKCVFGLQKKRFNILAIPSWSYSQCTLGLIIRACIILYNMIIDDERDNDYDDNYHTVTSIVAPAVNYEAPASLTIILQREAHLTFGLMFLNLQSDLIEHVWNKFHSLNVPFYLIIIYIFNPLCNFYFQILCVVSKNLIE